MVIDDAGIEHASERFRRVIAAGEKAAEGSGLSLEKFVEFP